jgi:glycosyltransferase involved in cell wall biosynthesis
MSFGNLEEKGVREVVTLNNSNFNMPPSRTQNRSNTRTLSPRFNKEMHNLEKDIKSKIIIVMPAYNAASTLKKTVMDLPTGLADEIILVDDSSVDDTVEIARSLGLTVITHDKNTGYGGNQKTCYDEALKQKADIVIMIHPDYQYDSSLAPLFAELINKGICDIVLGSRVRTRRECLASGMPLYKYISNRLLTILENIVTGQNLSEWHTGYRAYSRRVLEKIPYHANSD